MSNTNKPAPPPDRRGYQPTPSRPPSEPKPQSGHQPLRSEGPVKPPPKKAVAAAAPQVARS
jgi:hypothetical protein